MTPNQPDTTAPRRDRSAHAVVRLAALALVALAPGWGCNRSRSHERVVNDERPASGKPRSKPKPPPETVPAASATELLPAKSTHAVISGVLSWPDPGLGAFSKRARKDLELAKLLEQRGVPADRIKLLLDDQATASAIIQAVSETARQAGRGTTLLFYYAGHGVRGNDGKAYFASRDMKSRAPMETGLSLTDLTEAISGNFAGKRVVLMADCCYSGALKDVAEALSAKGFATVSLTSADAANVSTENWTFTQAIIDGLGGDALCDEDADGTVTLGEMASEVRAAMLYREGQRYGFHHTTVPPATMVARAVTTSPKAGPLPKNRRRYVEIETPKGWRVARVRAATNDLLTVRTYDYSRSTDHKIGGARTRAIEFRRYPKDASIDVYWGRKVWPAKVERVDGSFHYISYPGWPAYWNEWLTSRRIVGATPSPSDVARAKGAAVMVEWRGDWWPASVLQRKGNRHLIHYDGYDASWDEWVGPDRIRKR